MSGESGYQVSDNAAVLYERYAVPYVLGPWSLQLIDLAALRPGERVLDLACGTGLIARLAAPRVGSTGKVTGIDFNAGMLAVARALPPVSGPTIAWNQESAIALKLPDASIDVVLCQQGLQFFPDKLRALCEMHRVMAPAGRTLLSVWKSAGPYNIAIAEALEQYVSKETATIYRLSRTVPNADELHQWLVQAGFYNVSVCPSAMTIRLPNIEMFILQHLSTTPVAGAVARLSDAERSELARKVHISLHSFADGDGVAVPEETNIAMATR